MTSVSQSAVAAASYLNEIEMGPTFADLARDAVKLPNMALQLLQRSEEKFWGGGPHLEFILIFKRYANLALKTEII